MSAQVTVGIDESAEIGSLLQLKSVSNNNIQSGGANATRGLLLPRVELLSLKLNSTYTNLSNTIKNATGTWDKDNHKGLVVYNIIDNEVDICPGVYAWDGTMWKKLGVQCDGTTPPAGDLKFSISPDGTLYFASGLTGSTITQKDIVGTWDPSGAIVDVSSSQNGSFGALNFTDSNALPTGLTGGSATIKLMPDAMQDSDITSNLFATKESRIIFTANDAGKTVTQELIANQTNKAIKVDGNTQSYITYEGASVTKTVPVESNALWTATLTPASGSAVSNLTLSSGGQELYDGTSISQNLDYTVTTGASTSRYTYITFADNASASAKRFSDLSLTVAQCSGDKDLTMEEYKNIWESLYGLTPGVDEEGQNGDESKNTNQVQWHRDQQGNIFFSAMFGSQRWMTTNLAATAYAITGGPSLTPSFALTKTKEAFYGYPNTSGTSAPSSTTVYDARQRSGVLYNWYAATGNQNTSIANQQTANQANIQGICPNGWHLPSNVEAKTLVTTVTNDPTRYSSNTQADADYTVRTLKDQCEARKTITDGGKTIDVSGLSNSILNGGFSMILGGASYGGTTKGLGDYSYIWTSSYAQYNASAPTAWSFYFNPAFPGIVNESFSQQAGIPVRCVKD